MDKLTFKIGDTIEFKSPTRSGDTKAIRIINGTFGLDNLPTVRFNGWSNFVIKPNEIIDIY